VFDPKPSFQKVVVWVLPELFVPGEYFKFNSNTGHAEPDTATMQALSHFSYHHSNLGDKKDSGTVVLLRLGCSA